MPRHSKIANPKSKMNRPDLALLAGVLVAMLLILAIREGVLPGPVRPPWQR